MGRQRCAGRLQWMSLGLGDGTAEALRCQPVIVDVPRIADVLGI